MQVVPPHPQPAELQQDDNYDLHPEEPPVADENYDLHPTDDQFVQDQTYEMPPAEPVSENISIHQLMGDAYFRLVHPY